MVPSLSMGRVALTVNDLERVRNFYEQAVGLHLLRADGESAELGTEAEMLLELRSDTTARRRSQQEAGLFHTAFLLPERGDLAHWTRHAIDRHVPLTGASDHAVSEALYLSDPEGNGIEIYVDRAPSSWTWRDGEIHMVTEALDLDDLLLSAGDRKWTGVPQGSVVGHVHLQVGELAPAEAFYYGVLGLDVTNHYPGALFYAADGYHHHIATNIWNSRGADRRSFPSTGLAEVQIRLDATRGAAIRERTALPAGDPANVALPTPGGRLSSCVLPRDAR